MHCLEEKCFFSGIYHIGPIKSCCEDNSLQKVYFAVVLIQDDGNRLRLD